MVASFSFPSTSLSSSQICLHSGEIKLHSFRKQRKLFSYKIRLQEELPWQSRYLFWWIKLYSSLELKIYIMPTWFNTWVMYLDLGLNYIFKRYFGVLPQRKCECLNFRMTPPVHPFIHKMNIYWAYIIKNNVIEKLILY